MFAHGRLLGTRTVRARTALSALVICGLLFAAACNDGTPTDPGGSNNNLGGPGDGPDPQATLECEREGYPCSLADVPLAILELSDALSDSVAGMLQDGASAAEAAAWLEGQSDMVEVQWSEEAVRFRLEGGRGTWILLDGALRRAEPAGVASSGPAAVGGDAGTPAQVVVGPDSEQKHALVLSPFLWNFAPDDEGETIAGILKGTRGYEGGVKYLHNDTDVSTDVGIESFLGWGAYQAVHVSTHGAFVCDKDGHNCRAMLVATNLLALLGKDQPVEEGIKALKQIGLAVGRLESGTRGLELDRGVRLIVLPADFFRNAYPSGLDDTVVFLNACWSLLSTATDLVEAIQGTTSVVLGWDWSVGSVDAFNAAVALFSDLSEGGYPAKVAYERLGSLRFGTGLPGQPSPNLVLAARPTGGDLRIRDIVTLLDPASGQPLDASSVVAINGVAKDGKNDEAPYTVRVDGMTPELAEQAVLHVSIDGADADPVRVSEGVSDDHDRWTVSGTVPLGRDLEDYEVSATFRAWVDLPDEGKSEQQISASLAGSEPIMGREWHFVATETFDDPYQTPYSTKADLTLTFAPGQEPSEPHPRYVITGGTVTWDYNLTTVSCTVTSPVLTFKVTDEMTGISELIFDTTLSPVGYSGQLYTNGPEFEVTSVCGNDTFKMTNNANNSWMEWTEEDGQTVSADGMTISGTYTIISEIFDGVIESKYTITRIK